MKKNNLFEELNRYNEINRYMKKLVNEQATPPADLPPAPGDLPPAPADPNAIPAPADPNAIPAPTDENPPTPETAVPEEDTTEEIDITDLVNMTKSIKQELDNKKDSGVEQKMGDIFTKLNDLETKLQSMDELLNKIDNLENEVKNSKPKTPEEKLEMRSLDSYPFNENPQQFFDQKLGQMRASGKNEYVLTKDEIENYNQNNIMKSFNSDEEVRNNEFRY